MSLVRLFSKLATRSEYAVAALVVLAACPPARAADSGGPAGPALADTGIFAPVAAQQAARLAAIEKLRALGPRPELVHLLVSAGGVDEAAALLPKLKGDRRTLAFAKARVYLTRLDFADAQPSFDVIARLGDANDAERLLHFAWLLAHDDAPGIDQLTRGVSLLPGTKAGIPELLAAGRLAYDMLNYARSESCYTRALEGVLAAARSFEAPVAPDRARLHFLEAAFADAHVGLAKVAYRRRDYDGSLAHYLRALGGPHLTDADEPAPGSAGELHVHATPEALRWMTETLIRLGRTDEAIAASEWAVRLNPYHETGHYYLGNGYARKNYTQLVAAYPEAFSDAAGRAALAHADSLLAAGDRRGARAAYQAVRTAHPNWADPCVRVASLDFEDGRFGGARDLCLAALERCPEYGRAHATLAKALESQRFAVDVHRPDYERRFVAATIPNVPGIDRFVLNWKSLSQRHQKRVAMSVAPWKQFIPVLVEGGATYYIKPLYMLLSDTPGQETLHDQRISYDSRLWDDVRGAGGYHTVTGIEDVERTIFDKYNTVLHELSHQVHAVFTADQSREIQELYVRAKARDDSTKNGYLSRYAGGSVYEYFAEAANAHESPKRDAYDPREEVRERLDRMDPDLRGLVKRFMAITDVSPSYPVAYTNAGDDQLERGHVDDAVKWYGKALAKSPQEETALRSMVRALTCGNRGAEAVAAAERAQVTHPKSGDVAAASADAYWHGRGLDEAIRRVEDSRASVRPEDRYLVHLTAGRLYWVKGDAARALASFDSVLAYQSDQPDGLWGRAAALALARRWDEAWQAYDRAVRMRTGIAQLRCDYARDLLRAGRVELARAQLAEAVLLDEQNPTAEALRGWADLAAGDAGAARTRLARALEWGPWCDLARLVLGRVEKQSGGDAAAQEAVAPVLERVTRNAPPEYVYRTKLATWESVHELPAVERELLGAPVAAR